MKALKSSPRRRACIQLAIATAGTMSGMLAPAHAADSHGYPNRPIRFVVPFTAGGNTDMIARLVAKTMQGDIGQPVVVDNRPGAGGNIGAATVAKSAPDGYTLLVGTVGTSAINPAIYASMPYNAEKDLVPVTMVATTPNVLVVNRDVPARNVKELTQFVKTAKEPVAYGSPGVGTTVHLSGEMYKTMTHGAMIHVPYKGSAPAMTDLLGGQVKMMFDNASSVLPFVKSGKVRALAVTSATRLQSLPDVPTMEEAGVKGFVMGTWVGVYAPAGTPPEVVARLNTVLMGALQKAELREQLVGIGAQPDPRSTAEFRTFDAAEKARWGGFVRKAAITAE